jgi:hypothetical protein
METLSLIFSSLKFKKEKVFVGKEQKLAIITFSRLSLLSKNDKPWFLN